jgi:hypothetical protein
LRGESRNRNEERVEVVAFVILRDFVARVGEDIDCAVGELPADAVFVIRCERLRAAEVLTIRLDEERVGRLRTPVRHADDQLDGDLGGVRNASTHRLDRERDDRR